jgi:predicted RNA-binding Zn-ribbon protein involved in translation (DUF1610 family)
MFETCTSCGKPLDPNSEVNLVYQVCDHCGIEILESYESELPKTTKLRLVVNNR